LARDEAASVGVLTAPRPRPRAMILKEAYPLRRPYSYAAIKRNPITEEIIYEVVEPTLTEEEKKALEELKKRLLDELKVDLESFEDREKAEEHLKKEIERVVKKYKMKLSKESLDKMFYYISRDFIGYGKIEPLMIDPLIEDISCDGPGIPIFVWHRDYESIPTTVKFETEEELSSFIIRLAYKAGKHISIANPIVEARLPDGSRAVLTLGTEVTRRGSTFTIRKFRREPFTIVDLIRLNTLSTEMAAYFWYVIENKRSVIVAGGIATGKSVPAEERVLVKTPEGFELTPIGELADRLLASGARVERRGDYEVIRCDGLYVPAFGPDLKVALRKVTAIIRHEAPSVLYRIRTRSGREVVATGDHSVFRLLEDGAIAATPARELRPGDRIAVPRELPSPGIEARINLVETLAEEDHGLYVEDVRPYLAEAVRRLGLETTARLVGLKPRSLREKLRKPTVALRVSAFARLARELHLAYRPEELYVRSKTNKRGRIRALMELDEDFCRFLGYWVAEGLYYSGPTLYSTDEAIVADIERILSKLGLTLRRHGRTRGRLDVGSRPLRVLMEHVLGLEAGAENKRVPSVVFGLPRRLVAEFLRGYFSGDGHVHNGHVEACTKSRELADGLMYLLLYFGIVARCYRRTVGDATYYRVVMYGRDVAKFASSIGMVGLKAEKLNEALRAREGAREHTNVDTLPVPELLREAIRGSPNFRELHNSLNSYITGREAVGRSTLARWLSKLPPSEAKRRLELLTNSHIFWDEVMEVEPVLYPGRYVYDMEVNPVQNFVGGFGGIFLHNTTLLNCLSMFIRPEYKIVTVEETPELNLPHENWIASITRAGYGPEGRGAITLFDLVKAALRQRPDYIIVGEVRGEEAYVLFQAMATGHLGFCTIHAETIDRIFKRLESKPMNIPKVFFEALDVITLQVRTELKGRPVRRTKVVAEVTGLDLETLNPRILEVFRWDPATDTYAYLGRSYQLEEIAAEKGITMDEVERELGRRKLVLDWMVRKNLRDYKTVASIIREYYADPKRVLMKARMGT